MRQLAIFVATTAVTAFTASTSFAFISGEFSLGKRSGSWAQDGKSKTLTSTGVQIAGHLDPIPLVPVSFGLRLISETYDAKAADHGVKSLTSTAVIPEVTAWLPLGDLKPFARVGYTAFSAYKGTVPFDVNGKSTDVSVAFKSSGPRLTVGVEYSILPLISIVGALENSTETLSITSGKSGSIDLTADSSDIKYTSNAILVGAKAGI